MDYLYPKNVLNVKKKNSTFLVIRFLDIFTEFDNMSQFP